MASQLLSQPSSITELNARLAREGLPPAPLAPRFDAALRTNRTRSLFASRDCPVGPYSIDAYAGEPLGPDPVADYALVGFDGYGTNSHALHVFIVDGPIALFQQSAWGGAYLDRDAAAADIRAGFDWAARLQRRLAEAAETKALPPGWRLWVLDRGFTASSWRWLPPADRDAPGPVGRSQGPRTAVRAAIDRSLDDLMAGRMTLVA